MNSSNFNAPIDYSESLSEGCKFKIISKTTPADAVRSIILSKRFKFVAKSDEIWGRFLPPDYQEIIDRSGFPLVCNTKKELFFRLCDSPILLDGVAYLIVGHQLDIRGTIGTEMLSPKTEYAAYLVFKLVNRCDYRLESAKSSIWFVNYESEIDTENQANTVHLPRLQESGDIPKLRRDGWMEVKLGYFDSKKGTDGPIEARLFEMNRIYKRGLIVEGVEFRPK
ncbi:F-box protein PP2-B11-like [Solanum verrucosum]|uniref:F-box protein PP2-B11-like n=1 Tax=Solanum verrucosum TaxID=315347 RepID=UPI0020D0103A|nr:F-box protein PP2-B11-like [Solanum verrucosum]